MQFILILSAYQKEYFEDLQVLNCVCSVNCTSTGLHVYFQNAGMKAFKVVLRYANCNIQIAWCVRGMGLCPCRTTLKTGNLKSEILC